MSALDRFHCIKTSSLQVDAHLAMPSLQVGHIFNVNSLSKINRHFSGWHTPVILEPKCPRGKHRLSTLRSIKGVLNTLLNRSAVIAAATEVLGYTLLIGPCTAFEQ